jgi:hypothetical protein
MTGQEMQTIHEAAGVRPTEAEDLFSVALSTVYRWYKGDAKPKQKMMYDRAVTLTELMATATAAGMLPVQDCTGKNRLIAIKVALRKAVDAG